MDLYLDIAKKVVFWAKSDLKNGRICLYATTFLQEVTDKFRISTKELLSAEFPTLIALEFSLLTPHHQTKIHFDRIREID